LELFFSMRPSEGDAFRSDRLPVKSAENRSPPERLISGQEDPAGELSGFH